MRPCWPSSERLRIMSLKSAFGANRDWTVFTVYRVLEWLHEKCFVHRVVTGERVWRFRANSVRASPASCTF